MSGTRVRQAVALYLNGDMSEAEDARCCDLSRAELRQYVRPSGTVVPAAASPSDLECADPDAHS